MSRIKWGNESAQYYFRHMVLHFFRSSRFHPERIPKDCSNKFLQKISLHSSGMPPKLLKTPYHPYPSSLTQSSQLTPKLLRTPSQSSLIILPNPSQLPPNFLPTFSPTFSPKMASKKGGANKQQQQGFCPKSVFSPTKNIFVVNCGELWWKMCIFDG